MTLSQEQKVSRRYARALVELGVDTNTLSAIESDLADLEAMLSNSKDLRDFISSPLYRRDERENAIKTIAEAAKFHPHTIHFLEVLAQHRRLNILPIVTSVIDEMVREVKGIKDIQVISAVKMHSTQKKNFAEKLKKAIGQDVAIQETVDPSLLGGLVIHMGSLMIDDSLKTKLERLTHTMKGTA